MSVFGLKQEESLETLLFAQYPRSSGIRCLRCAEINATKYAVAATVWKFGYLCVECQQEVLTKIHTMSKKLDSTTLCIATKGEKIRYSPKKYKAAIVQSYCMFGARIAQHKDPNRVRLRIHTPILLTPPVVVSSFANDVRWLNPIVIQGGYLQFNENPPFYILSKIREWKEAQEIPHGEVPRTL